MSQARNLGWNMALGNPGLAAGTTNTQIATGNAISYVANGILKSRAAVASTAVAAPTTSTVKTDGTTMTQLEVDQWRLYTVPAGKTVYTVVALDNAGNPLCFMGGYDGGPPRPGRGAEAGKSVIPTIPEGFVPLGYFKLTNGFTPGTTVLTGATFVNHVQPPAGTAP